MLNSIVLLRPKLPLLATLTALLVASLAAPEPSVNRSDVLPEIEECSIHTDQADRDDLSSWPKLPQSPAALDRLKEIQTSSPAICDRPWEVACGIPGPQTLAYAPDWPVTRPRLEVLCTFLS